MWIIKLIGNIVLGTFFVIFALALVFVLLDLMGIFDSLKKRDKNGGYFKL